MRDRGYVLNQGDLKPGGRQGADGSLAALTGALDIDFYASESVLLGGLGSGLRCGLGGIGSALSGAAESQRSRGAPGECIAVYVGKRHDGVIERGMDMNGSSVNGLIDPALFGSLCALSCSPLSYLLLSLSSFCRRSSWDPFWFWRFSCWTGRAPAALFCDGRRGSSRSPSGA